MAGSQKIVAALRANWLLNVAGLGVSFCASIVLVRAVDPALFAGYSAVLAIIGVATFIFEAGANSGLTRYFHEASTISARGTFYRRMQRRRALAAVLCATALITLGPIYAGATPLGALSAHSWLFVLIAAIVAATLSRLLAHYGLLALFETRSALLLQQGFQIARAMSLAAVALSGGTLLHLVAALLVVAVVEAAVVHARLWRFIRAERAAIPDGFVNRAQTFGFITILDKGCAMLGSGGVLLLVLAPYQIAATIALLGLAVDLVGKLVSVTVMPMGNLVAPYLSQTSDDASAQALAAARVTKLSSLLYCFGIGAGALMLPWFVPAVYGASYAGAAWLALLLVVPAAFENWVRGCCSPVLLRNGRYRELLRINAIQAVVTIATLAAVHRQPVGIAIVAVGSVRAIVASLNLIAMRGIVPAGTYRVPLTGAAVAAVGCAAALAWGAALPLPAAARAIAEAIVFGAIFYAGMRWLIFRDADTLRLAHRVAGGRVRFFNRLLPAMPIPNA